MNISHSFNGDSEYLKQLGVTRLLELQKQYNVEVNYDDACDLRYLLAISDFIYRMSARYQFIFDDLVANSASNTSSTNTTSCTTNKTSLALPKWSMSEADWLCLPEADALRALRKHRHH
ncbi:hypothetical protein N9L48_05885, partial [Psychrosphaera sp.]|nr:hypothetical protein [Psychrosphaera sp.]